jgi:valyl-tRNA synthetase
MDTWATSSLTPQIAGCWGDDPDLFARVFPYDLRPQGPEIIRTWLFSTVLRAELEHGVLPWQHTTINGWILDPDRKKMSKSKDNVLTPMPLVDKFGADGLRYWACKSGPGVDTAADEGQMRVGRRLAVKILNAGRLVLSLGAVAGMAPDEVTEPLDLAMLTQLTAVVQEATSSFEAYEYQRALDAVEAFFWRFCDNYLELVKERGYGDGPGARSARAALSTAESALLRMFAPFLPFVAEEVWSWWQKGSVHQTRWPRREDVLAAGTVIDPAPLDVISAVLSEVRKAKSEEHRSQRSPVARLVVKDNAAQLAALQAGQRISATPAP